MLFYLILGIIFIIITLFAIIKIKFSFWTKQPVFHYYNLLYWIYPPGLITDFFSTNKYVNFTNITIYSIDNIPQLELKKYYYFIRAYYHNFKTAKYLPSKKYIISPLEANNYPSHILLYKEPKLLIENNKAFSKDFISEDTIIGGLSVRILKITVDSKTHSIFYVDNLCIHPEKRKQGISQQLIQTLQQYLQKTYKDIHFYLFKREGSLNIMVPLVLFETHQFKCIQDKYFLFEPTRFHSTANNIILITSSTLHLLNEFIERQSERFDCTILPELSNLNHVINHKYIYIYALIKDDLIQSIYVFKDSYLYENKSHIVECIGAIADAVLENAVFITGFNFSLKKYSKITKSTKIRIDDIADNHIIIEHLQNNNKLFEYKYKCAFYLYNYATYPKDPRKCFILY
jgi:hypothetical protein